MEKDKDLNKLFRANQNNYSERPSPAAWEKLNQRLENNRRTHNSFRPMVAAASIIALVGIIALLMLFTNDKNTHPIAENRPKELKELPPVAPNEKVKIVMEFTRTHYDRLSNPLGQ